MSTRFIKQLAFLLMPFLLALSSCEPEENSPGGKYSSGVFVINEGNFNEADGSVGFYDKESKTYSSDIFKAENDRPLAGTVQSYAIFNSVGYIVVNNPDRIEVVNPETFKSTGSVTEGLSIPRYFTAHAGKGYISNWGPYASDFSSPDSYIAVVDLTTLKVTKSIEVGSRPEQLVLINNTLYVASNGAGTVTVIDLTSESVTSTIPVHFTPKCLVPGNDNILWVGTGEGYAGINTTNNILTSDFSFENRTFTGNLVLNPAKNVIYVMEADYSSGNYTILAFDANGIEVNGWPVITKKNLYGMEVDPENGNIYVADNNGFQGNGTIIIFDEDGTEIDNFPAGRAPNGFLFK